MAKVSLPLETVGSTYFVDEAGSKGTSGQYFVTAAVRTTDPDRLLRAVQHVRDSHNFTNAPELKFVAVTKHSLPILEAVIRAAVDAECRFGAFVLDKRHFDPWHGKESWEGHLFATERLLRGMVGRSEIAVALIDHISVPATVSYGAEFLNRINTRMGNKRFVSAVSLDSQTCSGLQVADLIASAIFHYRQKVEKNGVTNFQEDFTPKARLSKSIAGLLEVGNFEDCKSHLLSLQTSHETPLRDQAANGRMHLGARP